MIVKAEVNLDELWIDNDDYDQRVTKELKAVIVSEIKHHIKKAIREDKKFLAKVQAYKKMYIKKAMDGIDNLGDST